MGGRAVVRVWYVNHVGMAVHLILISTGVLSPQLPVNVRRVLTGAEQTHGGLRLTITNTGETTFTTAWLETMPWFIQFFLHTMELAVDGQKRGKYAILIISTNPNSNRR